MVFFSAVFAARAPAMGNSADRAWQLSQLVEGVLTAFNPSHGSLSYVQAGHCVSKQIGRHDAACQGCPRCVSRSPEARCLRVFARTVRFSQPAVLSASLVIQLFGIVIPPIFLLKSTKRSAAAISRSQRSFITFHGALRIILLLAGFPATFHMITSEQTFVNGPLQKIFTCWYRFWIDSILSVIYISLLNYIFILLRWIFQRRINQRWKIQFRRLSSRY